MTKTERRLSVAMFERVEAEVLQHYHDINDRMELLKSCLTDKTASSRDTAKSFLSGIRQLEILYHDTGSYLNALKREFLSEAIIGALSDKDLVHDMPEDIGAG